MTLRERCRRFAIDKLYTENSLVDNITEFVVSEIGRAQHESLEDTLPLCLYFQTEQDRNEFMQAMALAKPDMVMRKV